MDPYFGSMEFIFVATDENETVVSLKNTFSLRAKKPDLYSVFCVRKKPDFIIKSQFMRAGFYAVTTASLVWLSAHLLGCTWVFDLNSLSSWF